MLAIAIVAVVLAAILSQLGVLFMDTTLVLVSIVPLFVAVAACALYVNE